MTLIDKIDTDIKEAMKSGQKEKLTVLRGLKSDIKYKAMAAGPLGDSPPMADDAVIGVLNGAAKKRRESIEQYRAGGRADLADKEQSELDIIVAYLPQQMGEHELREIIKSAIAESGADSLQKIGLVMKVLMPKIKGQADGKLVNRLVTELLAK
ncbi:MAG: GatB/YqeY domain-containing protein [candidate division Zixibacteria bacterium]|nr:GatB/YqeY domain-containing protein [candidate division Zixibacteria bacterium]